MDKQNPVDPGKKSASFHRAKRGYKKLNLKVSNHLVGDLIKAGVTAMELLNGVTSWKGKFVAKDLRSALLRLLDVRAQYTVKGLEARKILGASDNEKAEKKKKKLQARIDKLQAQLKKLK